MERLTNNDKNWGPFTLARWNKRFAVMFSSGDEEETPEAINALTLNAFGWALRIRLPRIIQPLRIRHEKHWDEATVARLGRNHYFETHEKEFGFSLSDMGNGYDFLQVHYGPQTGDSSTTKSWCTHLPWKQWDCVRHSVYTPTGEHFATMERRKRDSYYEAKQLCPSSKFRFKDYDGAEIIATCIIEEMEWHRGEGWFKWLKFFYPAKIRRSLDLAFSAEVGPGKGSWKGGTLGHGIEMLKGETPEMAFRRYCEKGYERKGRNTSLTFLGPVEIAA